MSEAALPPADSAVCTRVRLHPGSLERVRAWASHIAEHREDALQTLAAEGVTIESVFLDSGSEGDFLVHYMRAASHEKARQVATQSTEAIDRYHQAFKRETWAEVKRLEALVDLRR